MILHLLIFASFAYGADCKLPYGNGGLSLRKQVCEFPEGSKPRVCYVPEFRSGEHRWEGSGKIMAGANPATLCLSKNDIDFFNVPQFGHVWLVCTPGEKLHQLKLQIKEKSVYCPFPGGTQ